MLQKLQELKDAKRNSASDIVQEICVLQDQYEKLKETKEQLQPMGLEGTILPTLKKIESEVSRRQTMLNET
jgi:hypothetical protein